ncbi:hypothetical protein Tco_0888792 [Tanacetum coccineum]
MVAYLEKTNGNTEFHEIINFLTTTQRTQSLCSYCESSERQSEPQPPPSPLYPSADQHETQPNPSPRPLPTIPIPDFIPEGSGRNHGGQSSRDTIPDRKRGWPDTLQSIYDLCVSLYKQVTDQAKEIKHLKAQIKKLNQKAKPVITHHKAWMKSVSMKQRLAGKKTLKKKWIQKESVSKQGRKPAKSEPTVHKDPAFDDLDDVDVNDAMDYIETDAYMQKGVSTEDQVSTVKPDEGTDKPDEDQVSTVKPDEGTDKPKVSTDKHEVSTAKPKKVEVSTTSLMKVSNESKLRLNKRCSDQRSEDQITKATSTRSILTLKPIPKINPKDKGKKVLEEEAESEGVDEAKRKLLAARLQEEERETFTVEERAKFLYDTIAAQRRFLAQQRAAAIRSRPPTRTQLRNQMMTYLKHVGGKKHADLKNKNFKEIQVLYKEVKRFDKNFIAIGSAEDERHIKEMNEESKDLKKKRLKKRVINETPREEDTAKVPAEQEVTKQGTKKRKSGHVKMIARKRPRPQPDDDSDDEHRKCLRIVTFDSTIDSEIMETKYFVSKFHKVSSPDGDYLVVYRVNGHFRAFNYLMERLYEACGVCILELKDGIVIYMLVERRYPLSKELLKDLDLDWRLEEKSTVLHNNLVRFIQKQTTGKDFSNPFMVDNLPNRVLNSPCFMVKSWLVQDQTVLGKDYSNLLIADSLLKTIWFINAPCYGNEALASPKANELTIPEQTATGKGISNPFMAGSLPKTTKPT